jgi:tetratricopeptide (TPR) repeat protein
MTREQYIKEMEDFGSIQGNFWDKTIVERYSYFLMGRMLSAMREQSEGKTVLALMHPDRARLSAILQTKRATEKKAKKVSKIEPKIEEKKEVSKKTPKLQKVAEDNTNSPMQILQKRLQEIEKNKIKEHQDAVSEDIVPLYEPPASVSLDELVEKFNNYPPSITPIPDDLNVEQLYRDLGENSSVEQMSIISETLADIYISQKLFDKAIKIYQELLLKYPEKNVIFASLIENLRNKIKEN